MRFAQESVGGHSVTLTLVRFDEAGNLHSTTVGHIERPELTSEADLGLTHDDGKYLSRRIQAEIAEDQVRNFISQVRPCPCCGRLRPIKEHRRRLEMRSRQTKGQINRLKTLKWAMFGRAGIELLRARTLPLQQIDLP